MILIALNLPRIMYSDSLWIIIDCANLLSQEQVPPSVPGFYDIVVEAQLLRDRGLWDSVIPVHLVIFLQSLQLHLEDLLCLLCKTRKLHSRKYSVGHVFSFSCYVQHSIWL